MVTKREILLFKDFVVMILLKIICWAFIVIARVDRDLNSYRGGYLTDPQLQVELSSQMKHRFWVSLTLKAREILVLLNSNP